jgi:PadR family transcriptional regulator AphA
VPRVKRSNSTFAVLGLLGLERMSASELVQRMTSGTIPSIWPRAVSKVYEEPKRLVADGLARVRQGRQSRQAVYEITAAGRRWLSERLGEPGGTVTFESEGALKVLFAEHGTRDQLLATIRAMRVARIDDTARDLDQLREHIRSPERPGRSHLTTLVAELLMRLTDATIEWADWAEARVGGWDGVGASEHRGAESAATMHEILERCEDRIRRYRPAAASGASPTRSITVAPTPPAATGSEFRP